MYSTNEEKNESSAKWEARPHLRVRPPKSSVPSVNNLVPEKLDLVADLFQGNV